MKSEVRMKIEEYIWSHIPKEEHKRVYDADINNPPDDLSDWAKAYIEFTNNTIEE